MRDINAVHVDEAPEGLEVYLKSNWPNSKHLGTLHLPPDVTTFEEALDFIQNLFENAGSEVERDPHDRGVLHMFWK